MDIETSSPCQEEAIKQEYDRSTEKHNGYNSESKKQIHEKWYISFHQNIVI